MSGNLILLRDTPGNDVSRSIGLEKGPGAANANSVKLNAAIRDATDRCYTFAFPAGDWYFGVDTVNSGINGTCIELARSSGQSLAGKGLAAPRSEADNNLELPTAVRIIYAGPQVSLASLTHSLSGATLTITAGYTVKTQDVGATVEITGGTGADKSFYVITGVDVGAKTWTFDRAPGGSATNLTGLMTYTLLRDPGYGTNYKGLNFKGNATIGGTKCHVGVHFVSDTEAPQLNVGKGFFEQPCFSEFTAAVLCGRDMRKAYDGEGVSYTGEADDHCDHITMIRPFWFNCRTGFYMRNVQSVCNDIISPRFFGDTGESEVVYAERGGELLMQGGDFSGTDVTALRLGKNGSNVGGFHVMDCRYDTNSASPIWLKSDALLLDSCQIKFENCRLDEGITTYATPTKPAWHLRGGMALVIDCCSPIRKQSIQMNQANGGGGLFWNPSCEVRSSRITNANSWPDNDKPYEVVHDESAYSGGTSQPMMIEFSGINTNQNGAAIYDNGRYALGTGWVYQLPAPTEEE